MWFDSLFISNTTSIGCTSTHKKYKTNCDLTTKPITSKRLEVKLKCLTCSSRSFRFSLLTLTNVLHTVCPSYGYLWGRKIMRPQFHQLNVPTWNCFTHPHTIHQRTHPHTHTSHWVQPLTIIHHSWQLPSSIMCFWTHPLLPQNTQTPFTRTVSAPTNQKYAPRKGKPTNCSLTVVLSLYACQP